MPKYVWTAGQFNGNDEYLYHEEDKDKNMSVKAVVYNTSITLDGSDKAMHGISIMCDSLDEAKRMVEKAFSESHEPGESV